MPRIFLLVFFKKSLIPTEFLISNPFPIQRKAGGSLHCTVVVWEASGSVGSREWASSRLESFGLGKPPVLEILDTFVQMTCQVGSLRLLFLAYQVLLCAMIQQQKVGWHSLSPIFCCKYNLKLSYMLNWKYFVETVSYILKSLKIS